MKKPFYSSKKFLNLDGYHSDASIFTNIEFYCETTTNADCTLKIRDCSDDIRLSISVGESFDNSLFKIDTIINELTDFKEALRAAYEESKRRKRLEKEQEEIRKKEEINEMDSRNNSNSTELSISGTYNNTLMGSNNI